MSWKINKIISPEGNDSIVFQYKETEFNQQVNISESKLYEWSFFYPALKKHDINGFTTTMYGKHINKILFREGSVEFYTSDDREDLYKSGNPQAIGALKLDSLAVKDKEGNTIKKFRFEYDYFYGGNGNAPENKRLRLNKVSEGISNDNLKVHSFTYNNGLPPRESKAQDHWGYYNGKNNSTLVPAYEWSPHKILPGANRETDPAFAAVGMLKRVTRPTGGYSEFEYEAHDYGFVNTKEKVNDLVYEKKLYSVSAFDFIEEANPPSKPLGYSDVFHITQPVEASFYVNINYPDNSPTDKFHVAKLELMYVACDFQDPNCTDPDKIIWEEPIYSYKDKVHNGYKYFELPPGSYAIKAEATRNGSIIQGVLTYEVPTGDTTKYRYTGGARLKEVVHHDGLSHDNDIIQTYNYKMTDDLARSSGVLISEPVYNHSFKQWRHFCENNDCDGADMPCYFTAFNYLGLTSANKVPLGSGSHIGYREVTVEHGENKSGGTSVHRFTSSADWGNQNGTGGDNTPFGPPTDVSWRRGRLISQTDFDSNGNAIKESSNQYKVDLNNKNQFAGFSASIRTNHPCSKDILPNDAEFPRDFDEDFFFMISEWQYLSSSTERIYSQENSDDYTETVKEYFHDNPDHLQLTRAVTKNADGSETVSGMSYPADYPDGNDNPAAAAITKLKEKHIHNAVIEQRVWEKPTEESDSVLTSASLTEYNDFGAGLVLPQKVLQVKNTDPLTDFVPSKIENGLFSYDNRYNERLIYNKYDTKGNILEHFWPSEEPTAYIWDYNKTLPSAKTVNASTDQIAFTSFETAEGGGWTFNLQGIINDGKTGKKAFSGTATKNNLPEGDYTVSLWAKGGNISVNGEEKTAGNNWEFLQWKVTPNGKVAVASNNNALIDELRLHPLDAQMTSYTYQPLVGMTSAADQTGTPVFYEYDTFGRLKNNKDLAGNILRKLDYHYAVPCFLSADFTANPEAPQLNELITFTASESENCFDKKNYSWDFGDGNTEEGPEKFVEHSFELPGIYEATLTVTKDGYTPVQKTKIIEISPALLAAMIDGLQWAPPNSEQVYTVNVEGGEMPYLYVWKIRYGFFGEWIILQEQSPQVEINVGNDEFVQIKCIVTDNKQTEVTAVQTTQISF